MIRRLLKSAGIAAGTALTLSLFGLIVWSFQWQYMFHSDTLFRVNRWTGQVQTQKCGGRYVVSGTHAKIHAGFVYCNTEFYRLDERVRHDIKNLRSGLEYQITGFEWQDVDDWTDLKQ